LWLYQGKSPSDSKEVEIIIKDANLSVPVEIDAKFVIPQNFKLSQNYPNPFNSTTTFNFQIPKLSIVSIKVYDILGQEVKTLVDEKLEPNFYSVTWDGSDNINMEVASGIYFYCMEITNFVMVKKALFLK